jgi:cytochrome c
MSTRHANLTLFIALLAAASRAVAGGDADHGRSLYLTQCAACHSMDYNGVGPAHKGVFGRKAGTAQNYSYSDALKRSEIVWSEKTLDQWLGSPEGFVPGQKMGLSVPDAKDRADLIAYLKKAGSQ